MNRYLQSVVAGAVPRVEDWHEHLVEFHRTFPDASTVMLGLLRAENGASSYHRFAQWLHANVPGCTALLDVGCGDGSLLCELAAAYGQKLHMTGIDLCESDLERARSSAPGAALSRCDVARAQFAPGAFDLIVGHLSFALIPGLRSVLRSMHAWLRPGGTLAFVIEDPAAQGSLFHAIAAAMDPVRRRFPLFNPVIPLREPFEDDAVLTLMLREAGFTDGVRIERFALCGELTAAELWQVARRAYAFGLLPLDLQDEMAEALSETSRHSPSGRSDVALSLRCVSAHRR